MGLTKVGVQGETQVTAITSTAHLNPVTTLSKANDDFTFDTPPPFESETKKNVLLSIYKMKLFFFTAGV